MKINQILSESEQLDELSLGGVARGIGKGVGALAGGAGATAGSIRGAAQGVRDRYVNSRTQANAGTRATVAGGAPEYVAPVAPAATTTGTPAPASIDGTTPPATVPGTPAPASTGARSPKMGTAAAKQHIDQSVAAIKGLRADRRAAVIKYAQDQLASIV